MSESDACWGRVVGGDAYNYIIIAVRGVGWIVAGLTATVIGAALSIVDAVRR